MQHPPSPPKKQKHLFKTKQAIKTVLNTMGIIKIS